MRGQERPFMTVMLRDSYNDQANTQMAPQHFLVLASAS